MINDQEMPCPAFAIRQLLNSYFFEIHYFFVQLLNNRLTLIGTY